MISVFYEPPPPSRGQQGPDLPFKLWPFVAIPLASGIIAMVYDLATGLSSFNPIGTLIAWFFVGGFVGLLLAAIYATVSFIYLWFIRR